MKKNNTVIVGILCAIIVVLIAGIVVMAIPNMNNKEKNKENNTEEKEQKEQKEEFLELVPNDEQVIEAMGFLPQYLCGGLYLKLGEENKKITDFSSEEKLNMILFLFEKDIIRTASDLSVHSIDEKDIAKYFADLSFLDEYKAGVDTSSDAVTGEAGHAGAKVIKDTIVPFYAIYNNGKYEFTSYGTGCVGPGNTAYYPEIVSAKKSDQTLIVNFIRYYAVKDWNPEENTFSTKCYVREGDTNEIDCNNKEEFDHYEMVLNIKDGNLQLQEINYLG